MSMLYHREDGDKDVPASEKKGAISNRPVFVAKFVSLEFGG